MERTSCCHILSCLDKLTSGLCSLSDWRGDGAAVRLAPLLRPPGLPAHSREEADQQLQQGARPRLFRLQVPTDQ
jgi:hypothetical protein